jgi:hypothetical protein
MRTGTWLFKKWFGYAAIACPNLLFCYEFQSKFLQYRQFPTIACGTSVPDPWHFGVDPDPRIHASD